MKSLNNLKKRRGFTLVEMIIAFAIIGVLCAVILPSVNPHSSQIQKKSESARSMYYAAQGAMDGASRKAVSGKIKGDWKKSALTSPPAPAASLYGAAGAVFQNVQGTGNVEFSSESDRKYYTLGKHFALDEDTLKFLGYTAPGEAGPDYPDEDDTDFYFEDAGALLIYFKSGFVSNSNKGISDGINFALFKDSDMSDELMSYTLTEDFRQEKTHTDAGGTNQYVYYEWQNPFIPAAEADRRNVSKILVQMGDEFVTLANQLDTYAAVQAGANPDSENWYYILIDGGGRVVMCYFTAEEPATFVESGSFDVAKEGFHNDGSKDVMFGAFPTAYTEAGKELFTAA